MQKHYRIFILVLCLFFSTNPNFGQSIVVNPYPQNVEPTSIYIMWETDDSGQGTVEWGTTPFNLNNTATSSSITGSGSSRIHTAQITGLTPDSKYYYKVLTASGISTNLYNVRTAPVKNSEKSIRFVAMSDMQRDFLNGNVFNDIVQNGVIPTIQGSNPGDLSDKLDAILIPGDLVPTGGSYSQWEDYFFDPADALTPYAPIYPVPGNHEYFSSGLPNFLKYFNLPTNGSASNPEEWWYKDISNVRIIGLNSNSGGADQDTQLAWLQNILNSACVDIDVDFVFVELHHPYKSELWVPGELDFTGEVITLLEDFSTACDKPSIHFFGHTHAYSRGQSRDHSHLWVNVATAGGSIDYWGEFQNADYEEFTKSQDEYGFVVLEVDAGTDPTFNLKRYSRGDANVTLNNELRDEIEVKRYEPQPSLPFTRFPVNEAVNPNCFDLKATAFIDEPGDTHQASQWQISTSLTDFEGNLVYDEWKQSENWYNEVNTQANDDLTDEYVQIGLNENQTYYWRVRYRDENLKWSEWSFIATFSTLSLSGNTITGNLIINPDAETGTNDWTGQIESLSSNQCGSVPAYAGTRFFAVGGVCSNESSFGTANQLVDVSAYSSQIDTSNIFANYAGYMRDYASDDIPSMRLEFLDSNSNILDSSTSISNATASWQLKQGTHLVPTGTTAIKIILEGDRNNGTDNDCYFDELSLILEEGILCSRHNITPCLVNENLSTQVINTDETVIVKDNIFSTATISGTSDVSYKAGISVTMDAGFCVETPVIFEAVIQPCVD